ncbi:LacI family transcriptional regulator [Rubellimicrobium rubrum]|uniref:LacI family transcriptional regulator n=1 Tax=Rubellimicrobium rubrum TaxID=2585369 RepID=A0A5C4N5Z9_9RHOB|nr:LacI family DNA-binding transcriptional regulator [Rubellimicrobium rubrum]TNC52384.1 LacI family transcriptional regulator [Rubellimicrobium rubrum]
MSPKDSPAPTTPVTTRVTIRTVAQDSGVSVAAVSKVLRNAYGVSDALRARVTTSIERLGYRPNVAARGLRGQSFTLGILLTELTNPFLAQVVDGVAEVVDPSGYKAMMAVGRTDVSLEIRLIESMVDARMDGVLLIAPLLGSKVIERFARQIPTVVIGHHEPTATLFDTVNGDDRRGGRLAVEAFVQHGHRDIAMLSLTQPLGEGRNVSDLREEGYLAAMRDAGLSDRARILRVIPPNQDSGIGGIAAILAAPDRPRALFCWSDLHGVQVRNLAHRMGIAVPDELAILGYDNTSVAALPLVDLSSIDQDGRGQGIAAARALLGRIEGRRDPTHLLLPPHLVARGSA